MNAKCSNSLFRLVGRDDNSRYHNGNGSGYENSERAEGAFEQRQVHQRRERQQPEPNVGLEAAEGAKAAPVSTKTEKYGNDDHSRVKRERGCCAHNYCDTAAHAAQTTPKLPFAEPSPKPTGSTMTTEFTGKCLSNCRIDKAVSTPPPLTDSFHQQNSHSQVEINDYDSGNERYGKFVHGVKRYAVFRITSIWRSFQVLNYRKPRKSREVKKFTSLPSCAWNYTMDLMRTTRSFSMPAAVQILHSHHHNRTFYGRSTIKSFIPNGTRDLRPSVRETRQLSEVGIIFALSSFSCRLCAVRL